MVVVVVIVVVVVVVGGDGGGRRGGLRVGCLRHFWYSDEHFGRSEAVSRG